MIYVFDTYTPDETIPVDEFLKIRKIKKYYNRETSAAVAAMGKLLKKAEICRKTTPVYYATGMLEYEDYGLRFIAENSVDERGRFPKSFLLKKVCQRSLR